MIYIRELFQKVLLFLPRQKFISSSLNEVRLPGDGKKEDLLKTFIMKTNSQIRQEALSLMKGNWGTAIVIVLISSIISGFSSMLYYIPTIFVAFPLSIGVAITFMHFVRGTQKLSIESAFSVFTAEKYWKSVGLALLMYVYTLLWTLLFIVPGVIKSLSYTLAPYIWADNPELTADQAIEQSIKMMDGHKMNLFLIGLGMFGLFLLSGILLFIPALWIAPYYQAVIAKYYEEVKCNNEASCQ